MSDAVHEATVTRVEHYGLYVATPLGPALVLIPDVSGVPIRALAEQFAPGQTVRLRLLRFIPEYDLYKGTMLGIEQPV